ncbi:unnamed protein product [Bursaphelenchus xylophilus]|uniref:(pine wood nematode) hypothetical protein n=1 Tax=Bursaphelenchus xylophilus TaxID=6326 RepID=A0A1I7S9N9_BURXY|nr:unnamed protein product [Bursaphelenchus xylophilus]CAG9131916.1 unnamed protein product [Bursaphelenchus xylophilus]
MASSRDIVRTETSRPSWSENTLRTDKTQVSEPLVGGDARYLFKLQDDPEFQCCWRFNLHRVVMFMAALFAITAVLLIFTQVIFMNDEDNGIITIVPPLMLTFLANIILYIGNRIRNRWLYITYFLIMSANLLMTTILLCMYTADTAKAMVTDLGTLTPEAHLWRLHRWGVIRLTKILLTTFLISVNFLIFFVVYRDLNYVTEYPRLQKTE